MRRSFGVPLPEARKHGAYRSWGHFARTMLLGLVTWVILVGGGIAVAIGVREIGEAIGRCL